MRMFVPALTLLLIAAFGCGGGGGSTPDGPVTAVSRTNSLEFHATAPRGVYADGEKVTVSLSLLNISNESIQISSPCSTTFEVALHDADGLVVHATSLESAGSACKTLYGTLAPGEDRTQSFGLEPPGSGQFTVSAAPVALQVTGPFLPDPNPDPVSLLISVQ